MAVDIEYIHHYTNLESLALILSCRRIRFSRLDRVDDLREAQTHLGIEFGKYFFVSCWTRAQKESIPQWHMYTDKMTGVRISLPLLPFKQKKLQWSTETSGELWSPFSFEELFGEGYFIAPMFTEAEHFAAPVMYVNDIESRYKEAVRLEKFPDGKASLKISRPFDLARLKSQDWHFQDEYRFFLFILPSLPMSTGGPRSPEFSGALPDHILNSMVSGISPSIDYIDLELSDEALSKLVVTTGPLCTPGAKLCVESLVKQYAPNGYVQQSALAGTIREIKR